MLIKPYMNFPMTFGPDSHALRKGLVGLWPMWEGTGSTAMDMSGNGWPFLVTQGTPYWSAGGMTFKDNGNSVDNDIATLQWPAVEPFFAPAGGCTLLIQAVINAPTGTGHSYLIADSPYAYIRIDDNADVFFKMYNRTSHGWAATVSGKLTFGQRIILGVRIDTGRNVAHGIINGVTYALAQNGTGWRGETFWAKAGRIGYGSHTKYYGLNGTVEIMARTKAVLSDSAIAYLYANPYALITPPEHVALWAATSGGGVGGVGGSPFVGPFTGPLSGPLHRSA